MKKLLIYFAVFLPVFCFAQQRIAVHADPAITSMKLVDVNGKDVNLNNLAQGDYILKVYLKNKSATSAIPLATAYVGIGLGMGMEIDTAFDLQSAGFKKYFTYYYRKLQGQQAQINCIIKKDLPANWSGTVSFKVHTIGAMSSAISSNFLIYNQNPGYILADDVPLNNSVAVGYVIK